MKVFKYSRLFRSSLIVKPSEVLRGRIYQDDTITSRNKLCVAGDTPSTSYTASETIEKRCTTARLDPLCSPKVFVSQKCTFPRDILRNSGYKITYSKDNANFIIIPNVKSVYRLDVPIVIFNRDTGDLCVVDVENRKPYGNTHDFNNDDNKRITEALGKIDGFTSGNVEVVKYVSFTLPMRVEFIPYAEEYEELLSGKYVMGAPSKYVLESNVVTIPQTKIDPDALNIWHACPDANILEKMVMQSDYDKYPFTVYMAVESNGKFYRPQSAAFTTIFNEIENRANHEPISPEDFDMFQRWMMSKFGVSENGGVVSIDKFNAITSSFSSIREFMPRRYVVKPAKIDNPMTMREIRQLVNNMI